MVNFFLKLFVVIFCMGFSNIVKATSDGTEFTFLYVAGGSQKLGYDTQVIFRYEHTPAIEVGVLRGGYKVFINTASFPYDTNVGDLVFSKAGFGCWHYKLELGSFLKSINYRTSTKNTLFVFLEENYSSIRIWLDNNEMDDDAQYPLEHNNDTFLTLMEEMIYLGQVTAEERTCKDVIRIDDY